LALILYTLWFLFAKVRKIKNARFLQLISAHLLLGSILIFLVCGLLIRASKIFESIPTIDCNTYTEQFKRYVRMADSAIGLIGLIVFIYTATHTLFAAKYWMLSK
jgi:hypothetical protein